MLVSCSMSDAAISFSCSMCDAAIIVNCSMCYAAISVSFCIIRPGADRLLLQY